MAKKIQDGNQIVTNVDSNDNLTFSIKSSFIDSTPTVNSTNLVTSGGVKSALDINTTDIAAAIVRIANNETNISNHTSAIQTLNGSVSTNTTDIDNLETTVGTLSTNVNANTTKIGTLSNLTTTNKTNLVSAINELETDKLETSAVVNEASTDTDKTYSANYLNDKLVSVGTEAPIDGRRVWFKKSKNLINYEDFTGTITNYYFISLPSTNFSLEAGKTYTLSFDIVSSVTPFAISVGAGTTGYAVDIKQVSDYENGRNSITFTPTETQLANGNILFFRAPRYGASQSSVTFTISNVQLEEGSVATTYEPYVEPTIYVDEKEWYKPNNIEKYSTDEIKIGTWIDGKPLYRKVVNIGALPNASTKQVAHNISNMGSVVSLRGIVTDGRFFPIPYCATTNAYAISLFTDKTNVTVITGSDRSNTTGFAIIEYTKTTD